MIATGAGLDRLKRQRPEWEPWLAVVGEVLRDHGRDGWDEAVPAAASHRDSSVPLLASAAIAVGVRPVRRLLDRLIRIASVAGTPSMATLAQVTHADVDVLALFAASLNHDADTMVSAARRAGADPEALQAVVALLAVPFLRACNEQWRRTADSLLHEACWTHGHCLVCGSWPAFAEVRGIERCRYLRCARCGAAWQAHALTCPYCCTTDHADVVALVPERRDSPAAIEACGHCRGYVKTFTTLQGCEPGAVMLEDFASVDLDLAAIAQGYARPQGAGRPLAVTVTERRTRGGFLPWKA
jgi:FdhE protein